MTHPYSCDCDEQRVRDLAYHNEITRRRKLNNIPELHLTPMWLELAIAKDWSLVNGKPGETRARAEAEARMAKATGTLAANEEEKI